MLIALRNFQYKHFPLKTNIRSGITSRLTANGVSRERSEGDPETTFIFQIFNIQMDVSQETLSENFIN